MPELTVNNVEVTINVDIWCDSCGAGLCATVSIKDTAIYVPACADCIEAVKTESYDEGYDAGYDAGIEEIN